MNDREFFAKVDETLAAHGLLSEEQRHEIARETGRGLSYEHALSQCASIDANTYRQVLEEVSGCLAVDPSQISIDQEFIGSITRVLPLLAIVALKVFPVSLSYNTLTLAMLNPTDEDLLADLQATTGLRVKPVVTNHLGVQSAIERNFNAELRETLRDLQRLRPGAVLAHLFERKIEEGPDAVYEDFVGLVNRSLDRARRDPQQLAQLVAHPTVIDYAQRLLSDVIERNCSDIHFEPEAVTLRVRARVNGVLKRLFELPRKAGEVLAMRIKAMAGLDLDERTVPLDAQVNYSPVYGRRLEFRVSVLPTIHGGKIVLRVLEKQNQGVGLDRIGLHAHDLERVRRNVAAPNGLILVTGPTGSGKTSTLYAMLSTLNEDERCIVTAEEPVESVIPGVVQVACGASCSFATALRAFLRQDPDVIMVGEIRDQETADIALKAALTGHLVLSTLHTNDAPTAVMRLLNLDVDPFVVASSLRMVVAQRLIRTLCEHCKQPVARDALLGQSLIDDLPAGGTFHAPKGCSRCNQTGYAGRTGIFEILDADDALAEAVNRRAPLSDIRAIAQRGGMLSLRDRALALCAEGRTSISEVMRVTAE